MVFPLPLVAFEDYQLADDRPAYPMNFFIRMRFAGRICPRATAAALEQVRARHPMVTARVRLRGKRRAHWVQPDGAEIPMQGAPNGAAHRLRCDGIDIETHGGMQGYMLPYGSEDHLLWQFHHACCDGLAGFQALEDWLIAYAVACGDPVRENALRPLDDERLRGRGRFGLTAWRLLKKARQQAVGIAGVRQFLMRKPVPIVPDAIETMDDELPDEYPAAITHNFTLEQTNALRQFAKRSSCTVNDVLARDLFLGLGRFRERHSLGTPDDWLRLSVPMNLRRASDRSLSAANVVSMVFLDRRRPDFEDPQALLRGVHDEMRLIKDNELGLTFVLSLWLTRRLPGGLAARADRYQCTATCLLTNLGNLFARAPVPRDADSRLVVGGVLLESLDLIAPIRPYTGAAFTVFFYAKRLGVTLHYDPRMFSAEQAGELLRDYVDCVKESSES